MNTMSSLTTLSEKYQVVIPKMVRQEMHLTVGAQVTVHLINQDMAVIVKRPKNITDALSGLGKEVWQKLGGGENYLKNERASWKKEKQ